MTTAIALHDLPELEDLKIDISAEGTHYAPTPDHPFRSSRTSTLDDIGTTPEERRGMLREAALDVLKESAWSDANVEYARGVLHAVVARIEERGGCSFAEADVIRDALNMAAADAAEAVARLHVREVRVGSVTIEL